MTDTDVKEPRLDQVTRGNKADKANVSRRLNSCQLQMKTEPPIELASDAKPCLRSDAGVEQVQVSKFIDADSTPSL